MVRTNMLKIAPAVSWRNRVNTDFTLKPPFTTAAKKKKIIIIIYFYLFILFFSENKVLTFQVNHLLSRCFTWNFNLFSLKNYNNKQQKKFCLAYLYFIGLYNLHAEFFIQIFFDRVFRVPSLPLTLAMLNRLKFHTQFSQSDYLIQLVDKNLYILNDKQCRSRS